MKSRWGSESRWALNRRFAMGAFWLVAAMVATAFGLAAVSLAGAGLTGVSSSILEPTTLALSTKNATGAVDFPTSPGPVASTSQSAGPLPTSPTAGPGTSSRAIAGPGSTRAVPGLAGTNVSGTNVSGTSAAYNSAEIFGTTSQGDPAEHLRPTPSLQPSSATARQPSNQLPR